MEKDGALNKESKPERVRVPVKIVMETRAGASFGPDSFIVSMFILWGCLILAGGCISSAKKAQRDARTAEASRQKENDLFAQMRKRYPCDTSSTVTKVNTITKYLYGKPVIKNDTVRITDTVETQNDNYTQHTVVDSSAVKEAENRVKSALYKLDSAKSAWAGQQLDNAKAIATLSHDNGIYKSDAEKWDNLVKWLIIIASIISAGGLVIVFLKFKHLIGL